MCPYCICIHILRIIHTQVISYTKKDMGCVIPHQSNAVNIPHQTNAGLIKDHLWIKNKDEIYVFCAEFLSL